MFRTGKAILPLTALVLCGLTAPASASELVYQPVNPSFGGNPFNSAHLLGIANAQNDFTDRRADRDAAGLSTSPADLFVRQLQSRLLSALATQVTEAIFGEQPQDSGTIVFGSQTITFERGLETINLTIFDAEAGTTTQVQVPLLQVE